MTKRSQQNGRMTSRRRRAMAVSVEPVERRLMMTATATATVPGSGIEYTGPYGSYMAVGTGTGSGSRAYSNFGFISVPISALAPSYVVNTAGSGGVNSLSIALDNTATSGTYAPIAGSFDVYVLPDNDTATGGPNPIAATNLRYGSGTANQTKGSTAVGLNAIGSNFGTDDAASLGLTAANLAGTFSITASLPTGYSTFTVSNLPASVQSIIAADINTYNGGAGPTNTPISIAIVPDAANPGYADFEGSFSTATDPMVTLDVNETPLTSETYQVGYPAVNVNETSGNVEVDVTRTGFTADAATVSYTTSNGTATSGTNYTGATAGTVTFAAGQTQAEITVPVLNASTTGNKTFSVKLTGVTPTQTGDTGIVGSAATTTVTIVGSGSVPTSPVAPTSTVTDIETSGPYTGTTYASVNGSTSSGTGSFSYLAFEVAEFSPTTTPSLFPTPGFTVSSLSNLALSISNSATTGNYGGHAGNFNLYFLGDSEATTPTSSLVYQAGTTGGLGTQAGAVLLGTFSFDNAAGFDTYTPASLPAAVANAIVADLNAGTAFRIAITPGSAAFAADFYGQNGANAPTLALADVVTQTGNPESVALSAPTYSAPETAGTVAVTVNRSAIGTANLNDTETVNYATADGTAVAGTNYTAVSGTLTFGPGVTTQTINVPVANVANQGGDKAFTITLSNPTTTGTGSDAILGTPSSAVVTIADSASGTRETLAQYTSEPSTIEVAGPFTTTYLYVAGTGNTYAAYAALDFNDNTIYGPNGPDTFNPAGTVTAVNSLTLSVYPTGSTPSGPLDVYLVPDATSNILPATPEAANPHFFDVNALGPNQAPEGFGTQFGTPLLLGSFNYVSSSPTGTPLNVPLLNYSSAAANALITALNSGGATKFRVIIAPESQTVYAKFEGNYTANGVLEAPQLSIGVTEGTVSTLPAYLDPASQATYDANSNTVTVTGPTTIIADPGSAAPNVVANGSAAKLSVNTSSGSQVHLASLTLTGGAVATENNPAARPVVLDVAGNGLSIDAASTLNLGTGDLDVANGNLSALSALVARGYNGGAWTGTGITSSAAAGNAARNTAVGVLLNNVNGTAIRTTFDGNPAPAATDVLLKYTYYGDANLDGVVNGMDYGRADAGYNAAKTATPLTGWYNGDFNYDGKVDGSDYTLLDNAFDTQRASLAFSPQVVVATPAAAVAVTPATAVARSVAKATPFAVSTPITAATAVSAADTSSPKKDVLADQVDDLIGSAA